MKNNMIKPNLAQKEALSSIKFDDSDKALIVLPSGIGKTYLSAFDTLRVNPKHILYISHRNEIIEQASESFIKIHNLSEDKIGFINEYKKQFDKKIVFATIQSLSIKKNLDKIKPKHFDYVIIDEYHHIACPSYVKVVKYLKPKYLLGLTATPFRFDGKNIMKFIDNNTIFEMSIQEGIKNKLLVPFVYYGLWDNIDYSDIKWQGNKYKESDLDKKLIIKKRNNQIVKEFKKICGKRQTIGFCVSVNHIKKMVKIFNKSGIPSAEISYKIKYKDRKKIIRDFRNNKYQVLFTRDIFNEGVDFPEVESLLFLRPTFSKTVFLQQLGRGLRIKKGKKNVVILDFIGNYVNAYKIKNWLGITGEIGIGRPPKPIYKYSVQKVFFDKKVIDLFEYQESKILDKQKLIQNYFDVKKKIKKQPRIKDMDKYGKYSSGSYTNYFGSWMKFLKAIKEDPIFYFPKDVIEKDLVDNYFKFKKKIGHQPKSKEITRKKGSEYNIKTYVRFFGSWNIFLKKIDEPILMCSKYTKISKKELVQNYKNLCKKIGKNKLWSSEVTIKNGSKYSVAYYIKKFGSWNKFEVHVGEEKKIRYGNYYEKKCKVCGKLMKLTPCKKNKKYCSRKCTYIGIRKRNTFKCEKCGKTFTAPKSQGKRKYCSKKCFNNRHKR